MNYLIIFGAKYLFLIIVFLAGIYFLTLNKSQKKEIVVFACITLPIIFIFSRLAGWLYFNPRPFVAEHFVPLISHAADNGFPSDHTLLSMSIAMIVYFFNKKNGILLGVVAVLVGLSRVAAGVHHVIDILGSMIIAVLVTVIVHKYFLKSVLKK